MAINTEEDIQTLKAAIAKLNTAAAGAPLQCSYGTLFDETANTLEALNGTLRAAKRQKKVSFDKELLMMPNDKDVVVVWIGAA